MNSTSTSSGVVRTGAYPELTITAVLVGYFLGAIIAVSIGYAALILGFSIDTKPMAWVATNYRLRRARLWPAWSTASSVVTSPLKNTWQVRDWVHC